MMQGRGGRSRDEGDEAGTLSLVPRPCLISLLHPLPYNQAMRAGWNEYFMGIAQQAATRSTCMRKHVGAVIVRDRTVLSTGYNGSLRGLPHCEYAGCVMQDGHCVTTVHAEANAILQAAKNGIAIDGGELYTTASPCWNCFKLIANAGIRRIYYGEFYRDERSREVAKEIGMELVDIGMPAVAAS